MVVISALDSAFSKSFAYKARYHGYSERFLWTADGVLNKGNDCCFLKGVVLITQFPGVVCTKRYEPALSVLSHNV